MPQQHDPDYETAFKARIEALRRRCPALAQVIRHLDELSIEAPLREIESLIEAQKHVKIDDPECWVDDEPSGGPV
jgi:chromatin segregation and condensation protein Rec8/ScpA/Scc1 (kleisin family)